MYLETGGILILPLKSTKLIIFLRATQNPNKGAIFIFFKIILIIYRVLYFRFNCILPLILSLYISELFCLNKW